MESYSSDFTMKNLVVVNNAYPNPPLTRKQCHRLCGQTCSRLSLSANEKAKKYFSRFYKFRQMDFEYASWQMVNVFVSPQKLYRNFSYHHSTRNQWARDDPAFMILFIPWMFVSTTIYSVILGHSFWGWLRLLLWSLTVECILSGLLVATCMWIITNHWMLGMEHVNNSGYLLRRQFSSTSDDESVTSDGSHLHTSDVEWAYAFDIHLNALFPCIIILRITQPMFFYFIRRPTLVGSLIGNSFWLAGILYYIYITFLGYKALPFLRHTRGILLTGTLFIILYIVSVMLRWNFTMAMCSFYSLRTIIAPVCHYPVLSGVIAFTSPQSPHVNFPFLTYDFYTLVPFPHFYSADTSNASMSVALILLSGVLPLRNGICTFWTTSLCGCIDSDSGITKESNYWTHVKELLPSLKCLDNIATQSARVQRDVQNECDFDDEWTYINSVIDEFVSTPYITKIESGTEQKIMAIGLRKIAGKSSLYSVNRPTSSIHLTPDEKRQRVQVDEDGTIHDRSDSKEIRKWAESLPEIKPVSLDLTSGSVMCGNIGKSLRQRRNSICTPILSNDTKDEKAQEIKPGTECKKESAGFDGETEATIIKGLQNECRNILYELEEWRAKFLSKPRKYATLNSTNPKWNNTSHSERFTSRARQKPRALPNVMQPVSTTTQSKGTISDHPADDSKCPDTDPQTAYIELKRTKLRPVIRKKTGRAQSVVPPCKPTPPNENNFPPSRRTLAPTSLHKRPTKDSNPRSNLTNKPKVRAQQAPISLKPC
uniref:Protein unc 50 n=1 Tax=Echinococcus granulosus TaxID=6210 RepID=A0A068WHD5_ECHGR|nr:protein unc 50 [Echinococcus granulosus]